MVEKTHKKSLENISNEDIYECSLILGYDKITAKMDKKTFMNIFNNFPSFKTQQGYKVCSYLIKKGYNIPNS